MTSTLPKGILGSVASLLAATLYQGNPDRNHKLWKIVSSERYIPLTCTSVCACCAVSNSYAEIDMTINKNTKSDVSDQWKETFVSDSFSVDFGEYYKASVNDGLSFPLVNNYNVARLLSACHGV